jgi:hypothetical protein
MIKTKQESFITICKKNRDELFQILSEKRNILSENKKELSKLDKENVSKIEEMSSELQKVVSAIETFGVDVPSVLLEKKSSIVEKMDSFKSSYDKSDIRIGLIKYIQDIESEINNLESEYNIWCEKSNFAESIFGLNDAFYTDGYDNDILHLIRMDLRKRDLGLQSDLVSVFNSIEEFIRNYFSTATFEITLTEGAVTEFKIITVLNPEGILIKNNPYFSQTNFNLIPQPLTWIHDFYSKSVLISNHSAYNKRENYGLSFTEGYKSQKITIRGGKQDNDLSHEELFMNAGVYIRDRKVFLQKENIKIKTVRFVELEVPKNLGQLKEEEGPGYHSVRFSKKNRKKGTEYESRRFIEWNDGLDHVVVDSSILFEDLTEIIKSISPDSLVIKQIVESVINLFKSDEKKFIELGTEIPLSADEIANQIGIYWQSFINSPWDKRIPDTGALRMLKHLCIRGLETPDICSLSYKGHYRFNVRTRDHTWIVGEIFCPPFALARKTPIQSNEINYIVKAYDNHYVQVGDAVIRIIGEIK